MKRLTLVRHAKSSWKNAALADIDRPLSGRGKRDAPRMGVFLAEQGLRPDIILSSPARRARKTARLLARQLSDIEKSFLSDPALYEAGADMLLQRVRAFDETWQHILLVGHNPGLTDFANLLTAAGIENIPTCGVLVADLDIDSWRVAGAGCGSVFRYVIPGELPG